MPPPPRKFLKKDHSEIESELYCCIHILQKKKKKLINVLYSQFVDIAGLNALLQVVLSQHRLNYQPAIAKVSLVNCNRSKLTLKLAVCRTLLSPASIPLSPASASLHILTTKWPSYLPPPLCKHYFLFFSWKAQLV